MPTERMEVEVVLSPGCALLCNAKRPTAFREAAPGSLTEARLRLADAAEAYFDLPNDATLARLGAANTSLHYALAALRTARGNNANT